jgi:DNA polymerase-3 subunit epsilon
MPNPKDRQHAILLAQAEIAKQPVYLDTETTGLNNADQIVEIGVIDATGGVLFESLVRPIGKIPIEATRIHGITETMVKTAPTWPEVWPQVEAILSGRRIGIYNADFDVRLMQQSHRAHQLGWQPAFTSFCIMKLYGRFRGEWNSRTGDFRWYRLDEAGQQCRIALPNAHRAIADALLARAILHYMAEAR